MKRGVCFVAYGQAATIEAGAAFGTWRKITDMPAAIISDQEPPFYDMQYIPFPDDSFGARWPKLNLDALSPYDHTLYLDADTRIMDSAILAGFNFLAAGWDMVFVPSVRQGDDVMGHISREEREYTLDNLEVVEPLQLQAGVMFFAKNERVTKLFRRWRAEWSRFKQHDQAALLRALDNSPVKVWLLGWDFNSRRGAVVEHWFGRARVPA